MLSSGKGKTSWVDGAQSRGDKNRKTRWRGVQSGQGGKKTKKVRGVDRGVRRMLHGRLGSSIQCGKMKTTVVGKGWKERYGGKREDKERGMGNLVVWRGGGGAGESEPPTSHTLLSHFPYFYLPTPTLVSLAPVHCKHTTQNTDLPHLATISSGVSFPF